MSDERPVRCNVTRDANALPRETFPRGPSNEQTLLTELGEARRQLAERDELRRQIDLTYCAYCDQPINVDEEAARLMGLHIAACPKHPMRSIEAERDALAVTNERMRLALLRIGSAVNSPGILTDIRRIVADALLCTVADLDNDSPATDDH